MYSVIEPEMLFRSSTKEIQWNEDRYQLALISQNKKLLKVDSMKMTKSNTVHSTSSFIMRTFHHGS